MNVISIRKKNNVTEIVENNVFFPYTKGFSKVSTFFWVRGYFENYICTFKDCSSSFVREKK